MKSTIIILFIGILFLLPNVSKAQHKYEREYRIKSEIIPQSAKAFIDSIGPDSKIKWFKEISLNNVSIEAKFKHNKKKFSIEFDTLGSLQDVEFIVKQTEIPPKVYKNIKSKLDSLYQKWKFQKMQIQYNGNRSEILTSINRNKPRNTINVSYEIVIKGKDLRNTQLYEITFNENGNLRDIQQILQEKSDHLEY